MLFSGAQQDLPAGAYDEAGDRGGLPLNPSPFDGLKGHPRQATGKPVMASSEAKQKLVDYLERHAFDPILHADPDRYSGNDRDKLKDVQRATEAEVERYRHYGSAKDVVDNFKDDLTSDEARKIDRELKALDLPRLSDVRDGFEKLAHDLHVDS